jgi:hypothetical protein
MRLQTRNLPDGCGTPSTDCGSGLHPLSAMARDRERAKIADRPCDAEYRDSGIDIATGVPDLGPG